MSTEPRNREAIEGFFRKNKESIIGIGLILGVSPNPPKDGVRKAEGGGGG